MLIVNEADFYRLRIGEYGKPLTVSSPYKSYNTSHIIKYLSINVR